MTPTAPATDPLSPADEDLLAELVGVLSEARGTAALALLERHAAEHPRLAGQLRELFATMSMAEAVAEESTILERREGLWPGRWGG